MGKKKLKNVLQKFSIFYIKLSMFEYFDYLIEWIRIEL